MPVRHVLLCALGRGPTRDGGARRLERRRSDGGGAKVDRRRSALGNPLELGTEGDREVACDAYELLLGATLYEEGARAAWSWSPARVAAGQHAGLTGR